MCGLTFCYVQCQDAVTLLVVSAVAGDQFLAERVSPQDLSVACQ